MQVDIDNNRKKMSPPPKGSEPQDQRFTPAAISLPRGGGAIRGIGEKFAANPVTGTGSLSIPLPLSPGRSGFTPALALAYDSGSGNGPYGLGWSVGYPSVTRRTDRGLPRYLDADESDVFLLSGAEDLVPVLGADGARAADDRDGFRVLRYRPRTEGLFARIERWTRLDDPSDTFWRSISRDNVTTFYGRTAASRIADPEDPTRIFTWLLCEAFDGLGNAAAYEYAAEDARGVDTGLASEANRAETGRIANRYLKRVRYGNRVSTPVEPDLSRATWLFELVMDYGDHEGARPGIDPDRAWPVRPDPFSAHRAGFEVRTARRCQRVLMFHRFEELGPAPRLVRMLELDYDDFAYPAGSTAEDELAHPGSTRLGSVLRRVTLVGLADDGTARAMPPVELSYARPQVSEVPRRLEGVDDLPGGVDGARYRWVDLEGEGLPGVLSEQGGAWWYKPNLGGGRLGPKRLVSPQPSFGLGGGGRFLDLAGDGAVELVQLHRPNAGFFERDDQEGWTRFQPFGLIPNLDWDDPNLRFVDLTGDGLADVLITEDDALHWHPSLAERGFGPRESLRMALDEARGPRLVFHDATDTVFLADMDGDGLTDLVRVRNGEVCYWPNLGYGRFGPRVTMDDAPVFDAPERYEPRRLRLADLDGSGVIDLVYLAGDGVRLYLNRSGNGWSALRRLGNFPAIDNVASVEVADVLGNGTACLVWSSPLPAEARAPVAFLDLMGETKPHLLVQLENNLGARTRIQYRASTAFYLEDQLAGRPWATRLPFPVHVVLRTEVTDEVSRSRFVSRYAYRHGHFDGVEREFRGFGLVEQRDTEELAALAADQRLSASNEDPASHVPPVLTRTWFHTGNAVGGEQVSRIFAAEYYREPGLDDEAAGRLLLDDTVLPPGLSAEEAREARRALKGSMLRQEVYALDGTDRALHPYTVTEQNLTVRLVQPRGPNPHAVFFTHAREALTTHYERTPEDPRVAHALTLEVDDFGDVLRAATVVYGRRRPDPRLEARDQAKQAEVHVVLAENAYTNAIDEPDAFRAPVPSEALGFELTGLTLPPGRGRFTLDELRDVVSSEIAYEDDPTPGLVQRRAIEHVRTLYLRDDLSGPLPLGRVETLGLPFETYKLAFTPGLLAKVYQDRVDDTMLLDNGRYVHSEGDDRWWIPSGRVLRSPDAADDPVAELDFARRHFFVPRRYQDPFGAITTVTPDACDLLVVETRDAVGNEVRADHDYRVLQPRLVTDPNGNRVAASFDALGLVVGTAVMGKIGEALGDRLDGFVADLPEDVVLAHLADPLADPHALLGRATTRLVYDLDAFRRTRGQAQPAPSAVSTLARETHDADLEPGQRTRIQHALSYSDGFGREIQKKAQAEPGPDGLPRWVGSGWTVFDNKGKPVRQFEPFFTATHRYEADVRVGVSPVLLYDPAGRVVATLHPDHTWEKVRFDPWREEHWDVADTVGFADPGADPDVGDHLRRLDPGEVRPTWLEQRQGGEARPEDRTAAARSAVYAETPTVVHTDSLGRPFLTVAHDRARFGDSGPVEEAFFATRLELDVEGNQRAVIDARDRVVMRYDQGLLGQPIHQASMEAGERWSLSDVAGKPIYAFDSRGHRLRTTYDLLRRPVETFLREADGPEILVGRTEYGEGEQDAGARNLRGRAVRVFDQAGLVTTDEVDFKGNALGSRRQLTRRYDGAVDWSGDVPLETEVFATSARFDALNRPISTTAPDGSVTLPTFNEANLLERVDVRLQGGVARPFVTNIDYDAKGQRQTIAYGNGVRTEYTYDPLTLRLVRLRTTREAGTLQDLSYTYDPVGNVTHIQDDAQQTIYFDNQVAAPSTDYVYDAVYRLIRAEGREHVGQASRPETSFDDRFRVRLQHPQEGGAMRRYAELYRYDAVGNFDELVHQAGPGSWTRRYTYAEPSQLEPGQLSNRLSSTRVGQQDEERYRHDIHGNMTSMPHLSRMDWDFRDQLQASSRSLNGSSPETTFYVYDGSGQRVRKVTEVAPGVKREERIYLGGFEVFRKYTGEDVVLERQTLHVMDDTRRIAMVETRTRGDDGSPEVSTRFQLGNHLGSTSLELDEVGRVISYEEYYPYGSTSYQAGRSVAEVRLKRYRYTGMERDEETGFGYHSARYLAVWLGRWVSCDPAGMVEGTNLFAYVQCGPIRRVDPSGLDSDALVPHGKTCAEIRQWWIELGSTETIVVERKLDNFQRAVESGWVQLDSREQFARRYRYNPNGFFADTSTSHDEQFLALLSGGERMSYCQLRPDVCKQVETEANARIDKAYEDYYREVRREYLESARRIDNAYGAATDIGWGVVAFAGGYLAAEVAPLAEAAGELANAGLIRASVAFPRLSNFAWAAAAGLSGVQMPLSPLFPSGGARVAATGSGQTANGASSARWVVEEQELKTVAGGVRKIDLAQIDEIARLYGINNKSQRELLHRMIKKEGLTLAEIEAEAQEIAASMKKAGRENRFRPRRGGDD